MVGERNSRFLIIYCTIAGFISAWGISGLLVLVDLASGTPPGTFFAVIGISMGIDNPAIAQYVGFGLHVLTGTIAGNIFGQISLFVNRLTPTGYANGMLRGILLGIALWLVLFLPITVYVIQPKLNSIASKSPTGEIGNIAIHFQGLYSLILGGSFVFHIIYGIIFGIIAGRMAELNLFTKERKNKASLN